MKISRFFLTVTIFLILFVNSGFSQVDSIFTPFVSRIKIESDPGSIKISWKDTPDVKGKCLIYRHNKQITSENLDEAVKIASVPQGVEYYEDFPPYTKTNYYYGILMEDENSLVHEVFIPFRNISNTPHFITEKTKDNSPALITSVKAWESEDSIELSFKCSKPTAELFIYRNTEPIENRNDIIKANLIATLSGTATSFTDYPVPGIGYYYGIIDSNLIKTGNYIFKAGENITILPVELKLESVDRIGLPEMPESRPKPLPYLSISRGYQSGRPLSPSVIDSIPEKRDVSAKTESAINNFLSSVSAGKTADPQPVILNQNKFPAPGSEQSMLKDILDSDFKNGDYDTAAVKLLEFQKIRRDNDIEASVHFYLGQIYYFLGEYSKSFTEFLFAEDFFYLETRPWIKNLYKKLRLD